MHEASEPGRDLRQSEIASRVGRRAGIIAAGQEPKVAIVACMRKLIVILNTMLARCQEWDRVAASRSADRAPFRARSPAERMPSRQAGERSGSRPSACSSVRRSKSWKSSPVSSAQVALLRSTFILSSALAGEASDSRAANTTGLGMAPPVSFAAHPASACPGDLDPDQPTPVVLIAISGPIAAGAELIQ